MERSLVDLVIDWFIFLQVDISLGTDGGNPGFLRGETCSQDLDPTTGFCLGKNLG